MEIKDGFKVEIDCGYDRFWMYNLAVTCGCFDADDRRIDFVGTEDCAAPVGANLAAPPADLAPVRHTEFVAPPCDHILMYVYVIPHTLPVERDIADCKPFDLAIKVSRGKAVILDRTYDVNCWSGLSLELRLPREQK